MKETAFEVSAKARAAERLPRLGVRGILPQDKKKEMSLRRSKELDEAGRRIAVEDRRTWIALKRSYTYAEEAATAQFQNTVVFEPFGGSFGVTRLASSQFGWTCSQPMDILDGYDLLDAKGQRMLFETLRVHRPYCVVVAFDCKLWSLLNNLKSDPELLQEKRETVGRRSLKLVIKICLWQHSHGRFFLVENPAGSLAWVWEDLLARLLKECQAKFVISDQCAYGKVDLESGRPIRKPTGWLSNDEVLLNHLGKRCTCPCGSHELVLGNNRFGRRSKQAAAYPIGLCKAICQGILDSMKVGYASRVVQELSFAGEEDIFQISPWRRTRTLRRCSWTLGKLCRERSWGFIKPRVWLCSRPWVWMECPVNSQTSYLEEWLSWSTRMALRRPLKMNGPAPMIP